MPTIRIKHKVQDYDSWKNVFDNFVDTRKKGGEKSYQIWRTKNDPNDLDLMFEWDTEENARTFFKSPELKDTMKKAGVTEEPEIRFLTEADKGTL
jgi:heme-degrading monooxygenase HmoA